MTKIAATSESQLGGVALWRQIADALRLDIVGGRLTAGDRLDGELGLAERFGVNRHTVRRAISALADEGVVKVEHGRGTFVAESRRLSYPIGRRTRFSENLAGQARETSHELLASRIERATARIAKSLGLKSGARVVRLESRAFADGRPLAYASSWFPEARFPTIAEIYAETRSTTASLRRLGIDDYSRAWTRISARHADLEESRALKLAPGAVILVSEAVDVDDAGTPIQAMLTRFPADRLELVI